MVEKEYGKNGQNGISDLYCEKNGIQSRGNWKAYSKTTAKRKIFNGKNGVNRKRNSEKGLYYEKNGTIRSKIAVKYILQDLDGENGVHPDLEIGWERRGKKEGFGNVKREIWQDFRRLLERI